MTPDCCYAVTVRLLAVGSRVAPIDPRLTLWVGCLAVLAALNVGLWIWVARSISLSAPYAAAQLLLSGIYVGVCGFRSLFPRVDLERVCLWDSWLSAISLGRTAATVAELCFALQCCLFVQWLSQMSGMPGLAVAAYAFLPLAGVAQLFCWYAVLSLNHIGHAVEESLWALLMLILAGAFAAAAPAFHGPVRALLITGGLVYGLGAGLTLLFDVRMYVRRWRLGAAGPQLTLATGLHDSRRRRHPTLAWNVWREEVAWMTVYFSIGVWTSLAMVLLQGAA